MPDKGRRVASRQAQVARKRRRQVRGPSGLPAAGSGTAVADQGEAAGAATAEAGGAASPATNIRQPAATTTASGSTPNPARVRGDRPAASNYVKNEVVRISIIAGTLTAVLILISVFI